MILTYYCIITMIIIAYLLGSIPSAVWIGKKYYGIDIREHGSKNAGTTNMLRVLGRRAALPVFLLDFLKGFVAVTLIEMLKYDDYINDIWLINIKIIAVFAAVLGHIFPIFAGFRGGKGVAVTILENLGVELTAVRKQVEEQIGRGTEPQAEGNIPYTPRVRKVLAMANREAQELNHTYVGTEHLLLGLIRDGDGVAGQILRHFGVDLEQARRELLDVLTPKYQMLSLIHI